MVKNLFLAGRYIYMFIYAQNILRFCGLCCGV